MHVGFAKGFRHEVLRYPVLDPHGEEIVEVAQHLPCFVHALEASGEIRNGLDCRDVDETSAGGFVEHRDIWIVNHLACLVHEQEYLVLATVVVETGRHRCQVGKQHGSDRRRDRLVCKGVQADIDDRVCTDK